MVYMPNGQIPVISMFTLYKGKTMKNIFTTFCTTSLLWSSVLLYGFASGHIRLPEPDALAGLYEPAQPVKIARK